MNNLETGQAKRFARLFDGLIDFVRERLKAQGELGRGRKGGRKAHMRACHEAIWGASGDTSLIDRFLDADPPSLDEADRAAVRAWKEGIFRPFDVVCVDEGMLFVHGGRAFAVYGSVKDVFDFMETVPGTLECVLVPFDGHVTVGTWMEEVGDGLGILARDDCYEIVREAERLGTLVDTAERFMDASSELRSAMRPVDGDATPSVGQPTVSSGREHRGVLAGLAWQERERALGEHKAQAAGEDLALAEASCVRSVPRALATAIRRLKRDDLLELSRTQQLYRDVCPMNQKEAAEYLIFELSYAGHAIVRDVMRRGTRMIEGLRDVVRAGGRLSVEDTDADAVRRVPLTCEPYLYLRHRGDHFEATVPGDVCGLLEGIAWDKVVEEAGRVDAAVDVLESLASFRGIVTLDEAKSAVDKIVRKGEVGLVFEALGWRGRHDVTSCGLVQGEFWGVDYVVDADTRDFSDSYTEAILAAPWVRDMLATRKDIAPRDMADVRPGEDVFDWMRNVGSYQELVAFLDDHVPNGEDDYAFADEVASRLVGEVRRSVYETSVTGFAGAVLREVSIADEGEARRLGALMRELIFDVPRWMLNGRTNRECRSQT